MEHEEHNLRLKTLRVEYEDALIRKEMAKEQMRRQQELHQLYVRKAELEIDKLIMVPDA
jgi:hypothetical protein